ncbi:uncharacterized protein LOC107994614 [Apis cerana]|uniref:uncharacterized protein LOC107994614 n=1 Tax=Apis cerana TaxID=7461 RepID=UPI0007E2D8CB|nr:uncharacterized protein LOC107994614 [Apis cerana]
MHRISLDFMNDMSKIILKSSLAYVVDKKNYVTAVKEENAMPTTKEEVNQLIASHSIVIFSKTSCPFCKMAKQVFHNLQKEYTAIELNERNDGDEIQSILGEMTGARTVPRVFVNGVCLGGGTDVKKLYETGELQKMF